MSEEKQFIPGDATKGYDRHEARSGVLALVAVATAVTLIVFVGAMYWLTYYAEGLESEAAMKPVWTQTAELRERESRELNTYGYLDRRKGVVRVPVARAMELLVDEFKQGKVTYNTQTYAVKAEAPGGAAAGEAGLTAPANPAAPAATPVPPKH